MFPARRLYHVPLPSGHVITLGERPLVMGVVNVTPDSFAERSSHRTAADAVDLALRMVDEGADIIDIGGESTRPGTDAVAADEEAARVMPVVAALAGRLSVPLSVDTYKAAVAGRALAEGADIINDISGLRYDSGLAGAVADGRGALVVMHMRGRPKTMYAEAAYGDLAADLSREIGESLAMAAAAGIDLERVIVDPGIGFAKRPDDSYRALALLPELSSAVQRPVLVGPSRKSFMSDALGGRPAIERDWGTAAAVTTAVLAGAHIVRVHAVAEMVQVVRVAEEIRRRGVRTETWPG